MINVNEIGHDHLGNIKYVFDYEKHEYTDKINDDIPKIIEDICNNNENSKFIKYVESERVLKEDILVPRYYFDSQDSIESNNIFYKTLNELIDEGIIESFKGHGSPKSIYKVWVIFHM